MIRLLVAVLLRIRVSWDGILCRMTDNYGRFGRIFVVLILNVKRSGNYLDCSDTELRCSGLLGRRILGLLTLEDRTNRLSRNVGKESPLHAA